MTPTRKLKRALMLERFKALVDSMYDEREERLVAREDRRSLYLGGNLMKLLSFSSSCRSPRRRRMPT